ncbi:MAG: 3-deoxy-manno-octulosonate cytidylyltransferase [Desulfonauticus sp.]|nr:3-deoxy-manno-octulosonate cytidylyltransferase [Desulfonauticus sp.]
MNTSLPCFAIIPARYASKRFPGKVLATIAGKPMFWHVYHRAKQCPFLQEVYLATDNDLILTAAKDLNVPAVLTSDQHKSGTDRVMEAALKLNLKDSIILNLQADEPLLTPQMLSELISPFAKQNVQVTTLARPITREEAQNLNQVKVVMDKRGFALYFSRNLIPYPRASTPVFWGHIGLYAYTYETLELFSRLPESQLEQVEKLEQLRLLENDIPIFVAKTRYKTIGVDTPQELEVVRKIFEQKGEMSESHINA